MLKTTLGLGVILAIASIAPSFAGYTTLELNRSKIKFPKYSPETKKLVFNQAKMILNDVFVHRDLKIKDFGQAANAKPRLDALEKKLATVSDNEFHGTMTDIFRDLKDLHTIYYLPRPFACYESFLPVFFKHVKLANGKSGYAITDYHVKKEIADLIPKPFNVAIGDMVISYNGKPIDSVVKAAMPESYGANTEAQFRLAQDDVRYFNHEIDPLPKDNFVTMEFQNAKGERYKHKLPFISWSNEECLQSSTTQSPLHFNKKRMGSVKGETEEPILYWHINRPSFGNFGYIEISSFTPEVLSDDQTAIKIRDLLLNELKDTDGLVFDLRSNGGGQIPLAEKIIQLFSPKEVEPLKYILRNTETNYVYYKKSDYQDAYTDLLETARSLGTPFTAPGTISNKAEINDLGMVYFKPVAVFVNSKCYSACEVFAAQVQDHGVGTIFGEDKQTGGGGANYYTLNKILDEKNFLNDPAPFVKLPKNQEIIFAFRQAVRVGKNAGKLIEDEGVIADKLSPMSHTDIFNKTNDQMLVLQNYLASITGQYTSSIYFDSEDRHDIVQGQIPQVKATWTDTTTFEFKQSGKTIEKKEVELNSASAVTLPVSTNDISEGSLEIYGSNKDVPVWRKIVRYRVVPEFKPAVKDENLMQRLSIYSVISTKENGWQRNGDELIVGDGKLYQNQVESEASLFVTVPASNPIFSFNVSADLEDKFDYFKVYVIPEGHEPILIKSVTGHQPEEDMAFNFAPIAGMNAEIRFVFKSDEGTKDRGVTLKSVKLAFD